MIRARRARQLEVAVLRVLEDALNTLDDLKRDEPDQYVQDLLAAVADVRETRDLEPLIQAVEAWQRTTLFSRQRGFEQKIARAKPALDDEDPMTWDEIRDTLAV